MLAKIKKTADFLRNKINTNTTTGIILGTGLGNLAEQITEKVEISYTEIPNFPISTVEGHSGKFIIGKLGKKNIVAMQGRFHYYEGYNMKEVTFPIRVMQTLGIKNLILSNAGGGMNPDFKIGDLMLITDHINLFPENPLRGKNFDELGTRFPDMSEAYSKDLLQKARILAKKNNIDVKEGVYVGTTGPNYETPAEYKYFRTIGGDVVGMSTVPEVIVAKHANMNCFAISIITDLGVEGKIVEVSHEKVQDIAKEAEPKMTLIIKELVDLLI
jgi:purine-nucleoside phosphorylase